MRRKNSKRFLPFGGACMDTKSKRRISHFRGTDVKYECKIFNGIMDVWLFEYDGDLHLEDATTDEVADCRWMTVSEISI